MLEVGRDARVVAVDARDRGRAHEPGDLGRDRARRVALLVLPALLLGDRPVLDDEVGRLADVAPVARAVAPELPGEHDRQADLVHLQPLPLRRAVDLRVLRERAVVELLLVEQEVERGVGRGLVARRQQRRGDLVEVARPDEVVRRRARVVGVDAQLAPAPRHRRRRDERARVVLVLVRLEHEQRGLVGGEQRDRGGRRRLEPVAVLRPSRPCSRRRPPRSRRRATSVAASSAAVPTVANPIASVRSRCSPRPVRRVWACWTTLPGRSAS